MSTAQVVGRVQGHIGANGGHNHFVDVDVHAEGTVLDTLDTRSHGNALYNGSRQVENDSVNAPSGVIKSSVTVESDTSNVTTTPAAHRMERSAVAAATPVCADGEGRGGASRLSRAMSAGPEVEAPCRLTRARGGSVRGYLLQKTPSIDLDETAEEIITSQLREINDDVTADKKSTSQLQETGNDVTAAASLSPELNEVTSDVTASKNMTSELQEINNGISVDKNVTSELQEVIEDVTATTAETAMTSETMTPADSLNTAEEGPGVSNPAT